MDRATLAPDYTISRVIRGGWQLAGGHGAIDRDAALEDLLAAADAGITTFDCADIYTGVEELYGRFRRAYADRRGAEAAAALRFHTKCVPDLAALPTLRRDDLTRQIDTSLRRLGTERLDLVQFHWWDTAVPGAVEAMGWLDELRRGGKIELLGVTNFDTAHVDAIVAAGIPLATIQLQYSLLDRRPAGAMADAAARHGFAFLAYGTVAGGFLSDRWLGAPEPREPLENRSLTKYKLIIDDCGGWGAFQALLAAVRAVADEAGSDIATVASRAVLERAHVAAVIVGARNRAHLGENVALGALRLTPDQLARVEAASAALRPLDGDVYALERDRTGRHGSIMKYNLNTGAAA
jgi:aryl-alcohol dehydrogenase-like predicted oxidoreductase